MEMAFDWPYISCEIINSWPAATTSKKTETSRLCSSLSLPTRLVLVEATALLSPVALGARVVRFRSGYAL